MAEKLTQVELSSIQLHETKPRSLEKDPSLIFQEDDIETGCGLLHIVVQGNPKNPAIITYHDIGLNSTTCFQSFFNYPEMKTILESFCVYHINAPGQQEGCLQLPQGSLRRFRKNRGLRKLKYHGSMKNLPLAGKQMMKRSEMKHSESEKLLTSVGMDNIAEVRPQAGKRASICNPLDKCPSNQELEKEEEARRQSVSNKGGQEHMGDGAHHAGGSNRLVSWFRNMRNHYFRRSSHHMYTVDPPTPASTQQEQVPDEDEVASSSANELGQHGHHRPGRLLRSVQRRFSNLHFPRPHMPHPHFHLPHSHGGGKDSYTYPTMDQLAEMIMPAVLFYGIKRFIGFGVGAGANILSRFALKYPNHVDALVILNCTAAKSGWTEWGYQKLNSWWLRGGSVSASVEEYLLWHWFGSKTMEENHDLVHVYSNHVKTINPTNLAHFIESYINRTDLGIVRETDPQKKKTATMIRCPVMLVAGSSSPHINDTINMNGRMDPSECQWMKFECGGMVMEEAPAKLAEAFRLFIQGMGYVTSLSQTKIVAQRSQMSAQIGSSTAENNEHAFC